MKIFGVILHILVIGLVAVLVVQFYLFHNDVSLFKYHILENDKQTNELKLTILELSAAIDQLSQEQKEMKALVESQYMKIQKKTNSSFSVSEHEYE